MRRIGKRHGLSLIELLFAVAIISIGLGSFYAVMHRGLDFTRTTGSKNYALAAAVSELEIVKAMASAELPEHYEGPFLGEVDLSGLTDAKGTLKIEDYGNAKGRLKTVTATVTWTVAGKDKSTSLSTVVGNP